MAPDAMAAPPKTARRPGAHLARSDESGLLMAPLVRRTGAPRGPTPDLDQGGGPRQKVAVAAAWWLSPRRDRLGLEFQTVPNGSVENWDVTAVLEALVPEWDGRYVLVGDGGPMHRGDPIRHLASPFRDRLTLEDLPPWAPMRCPIEPRWGWRKDDQWCTWAPHDTIELKGRVIAELRAVRDDQVFLKNLFHASELPLPRTLLS